MRRKVKSTKLSDRLLILDGYKLVCEKPIEDDTNIKEYVSNMSNINDNYEYVYKTTINHHSYKIIKVFAKECVQNK